MKANCEWISATFCSFRFIFGEHYFHGKLNVKICFATSQTIFNQPIKWMQQLDLILIKKCSDRFQCVKSSEKWKLKWKTINIYSIIN